MKKLLILVLLAANHVAAQTMMLSPGDLKPGFISITRFDASRIAVQEQIEKNKGRIIQINIWYPSSGGLKQLCFADYVHLAGKELDSSTLNNTWQQKGIDKYFDWPASLKAGKRIFTDFLDKKIHMMGLKDATWNQKKYPLVLLVHGFAANHAYLAEYIASYGYVVMQVPVKGSATYELDYEGKGLEAQVLDYEFALNVLRKEFHFFTSGIAIAGFSFGGISAVALTLKHTNIKCIVSLDGGIGSDFGGQLLSKQSYYKAGSITAPLLHLYNPKDTYTDLTWLDTLSNSQRFLAAMKNMEHGHFTSFGLLNRKVPGIMGKTAPDPGNGYETIMLLTKEFLDMCLKNKKADTDNFFNHQYTKYPWIKTCITQTNIYIPKS